MDDLIASLARQQAADRARHTLHHPPAAAPPRQTRRRLARELRRIADSLDGS